MTSTKIPLRVDFGGGWTDVPRLSRPGAYIVNCAIQPLVSLDDWPFMKGSGLGGSAAHAILQGRNAFESEESLGVGWQDPAVIQETGLCIWRSGSRPVLEAKVNPDWLNGLMALYWTGNDHNTPSYADSRRDYDLIVEAGQMAASAVKQKHLDALSIAIGMSYRAQIKEGMKPLPDTGSLYRKYCGGGWGGYAMYLFASQAERDVSGLIPIEPYLRDTGG